MHIGTLACSDIDMESRLLADMSIVVSMSSMLSLCVPMYLPRSVVIESAREIADYLEAVDASLLHAKFIVVTMHLRAVVRAAHAIIYLF